MEAWGFSPMNKVRLKKGFGPSMLYLSLPLLFVCHPVGICFSAWTCKTITNANPLVVTAFNVAECCSWTMREAHHFGSQFFYRNPHFSEKELHGTRNHLHIERGKAVADI